MWNLRPEEIPLPVPGLSVGVESDRIKRNLEEVDRLSVVLRQEPDEFVLVGTCQVQNVVFEDKVFLEKCTKLNPQFLVISKGCIICLNTNTQLPLEMKSK